MQSISEILRESINVLLLTKMTSSVMLELKQEISMKYPSVKEFIRD